jgi:hypothetical protein
MYHGRLGIKILVKNILFATYFHAKFVAHCCFFGRRGETSREEPFCDVLNWSVYELIYAKQGGKMS